MLAQEHVINGCHEPLSHDDPLCMVGEFTSFKGLFQTRGAGFLELQDQPVFGDLTFEQDNHAVCSDTADAVREIQDTKPFQEVEAL